MPVNQVLFLDLTDEIQHFLRAPDGKGRYHEISAAVERALHDFRKFGHIIDACLMIAVAVSRFNQKIVCIGYPGGIPDQRLGGISDIA